MDWMNNEPPRRLAMSGNHRSLIRASFRPQVEALERRELLTAGALDPSFGGGDGTVTQPVDFAGHQLALLGAMVQQPNGQIVVAGSVQTDKDLDFAVARFNADGSLDSHFGINGITTFGFDLGGANTDRVGGLVLQQDGKIVVAGTVSTGAQNDFGVARLTTAGKLDSSFGNGGKISFSFNPFQGQSDNEVAGVAIQSTGKIVVAGTTTQVGSNAPTYFAVARLNPADGSIDKSFNNDLFGQETIPWDVSACGGVAVQKDDNIVIIGTTASTTKDGDFAVTRLLKDGGLDTGFGNDGKQTVDFSPNGTSVDRASALAIESDGSIVIAGNTQAGSENFQLAVARLTKTGNIDISFDFVGRTSFRIANENTFATAVAVQADGKIDVGAYAYAGTGTNTPAVARINGEGILGGTLDDTFGSGGKTTFQFASGTTGSVQAMALTSNGKITVGGIASTGGLQGEFALARLLPTDVPVAPSAAPVPTPIPNGDPAIAGIFAMPMKARGKTRINIYSLATGALLASLGPYRGKVQMRLRDLNGDGVAEILLTIMSDGRKRTLAFDGRTVQPVTPPRSV
jgi:uncharacterized delta-60 repeat protein